MYVCSIGNGLMQFFFEFMDMCTLLLRCRHVQPAWLANAAEDPTYKPRIQRISSVPMKEDSEYHDPDENASTSPLSPSSNAQPPTPPSHKNFVPPNKDVIHRQTSEAESEFISYNE